MQLANCRQCGDIFFRHGGNRRCPTCIQAEEDAYRTVVAHVRETSERSIPRIAEATGVDRRLIIRWLRQKRLAFDVVPGELQCRRCGVSVAGGTFCDSCRQALAAEVAEQRRLMEHPDEAPAARRNGPHSRRTERSGMHYRSYSDGRSSSA